MRSLVSDLFSHDGSTREAARDALVNAGSLAAPYLIDVLTSPNEHARWEAVKALEQICDPRAAPALVTALQDQNGGIRWLAAEALIALRRDGLAPLCQALIRHSDSVWLREGAHHIARTLSKGRLHDVTSPLLSALEGADPALEVPLAAEAVFEQLREQDSKRTVEKH
jgi:HEAT repeat protein